MVTASFLASGVCWSVAYVLIIIRGLRDRSYGMPLVALCANLSWEFVFSVVRPHHGVQRAVDVVWLCLDLVIAYTVLRYGPREFPHLPRGLFYAGFAVTLVLAYLGVDLVCRTFDHGAGSYAAFGQNLMMSALYLAMLNARRARATAGPPDPAGRGALAGQSAAIAAAKLAGTALASLGSWRSGGYTGSAAMTYLYLATAALDLAYLAAVLATGRSTRRPAGPSRGTPPAQPLATSVDDR